MLLGIDRGSKRIGLAYHNIITMPIGTIANDGSLFFQLAGIIEKHHITTIIVGLPSDPRSASRIKEFISQLRFITSLPIETVNEDYSSVMAKGSDVDCGAAMVILDNRLGNDHQTTSALDQQD